MKLKIDENGAPVVEDGKPVYVTDEGDAIPVDVPSLFAKVEELNGEAARRRHKASELEEQIKAFEGLDPKEARKALETVNALSNKELIEAGDVEKVRQQAVAEANKTWEEKYSDLQKQAEEARNRNRSLMVSGRFASSKALEGTVYKDVPGHAERVYGDAFKVEGDKVIAYHNGEPIFSKKNPGEHADFDEALSILIDRDPHRDSIKLTTVAKGSGSQSGTASANGSGIDPDLPPAERVKQFRQKQAQG